MLIEQIFMIMEQNRRFADMLETLKKKGVVRNQQQFVEMVGVDKSLVSNVKNEKVPLSDDLLQKVEKAFPMVSVDWIKSGEGPMILPEDHFSFGGSSEKMVSLPLLPVDVMAGLPSEDIAGVDFSTCDKYLIPDIQAAGAQYMVRVTGDSMIPTYKEGDILACRFVEDVQFWQPGRVYVLDTNQGPLVKMVFECEDEDHLICHSFNTERFKDFRIPKTAIRSVSIVVGVVSIRTE
jgi:SOS-response transcriptional repressor LexA